MLLPPPPLLRGGNAAGEQIPAQAVTGLPRQTGLSQVLEAPSLSPGPGKHPLEQSRGTWDAPSVCHKCWDKEEADSNLPYPGV